MTFLAFQNRTWPTAGGGGITTVGTAYAEGATNSMPTIDLTGISGANDDYILVQVVAASNADRVLSVSGYTEIHYATHNDTYRVMHYIGYLKVTSGFPTSVVTSIGTPASQGAVHATAIVLRGCDLTTFLDVAVVNSGGTNSGIPAPAAITPVTSGALIFNFGSNASDQGGATSFTQSGSDYDSFVSSSKNGPVYDTCYGIGTKAWTSGTFTPGAWTWSGTDGIEYSRNVASVAVRPA